MLEKVGVRESNLSKRGTAFNTTTPRFQTDHSRSTLHARNKTVDDS